MSDGIKYAVREIPGGVGKEFVREHHYSRTCHNGPMCWGLFDGDRLIGVCAFATPSSENVRASVFGRSRVDEVTELHRLVILDETPCNTESWFIRRALAGLRMKRPRIRAVLSFADSSEGHEGIIYQATNALYCGTTSGRSRFWRDGEGRLRHPRQNGHNVTPAEAAAMGWIAEYRGTKRRYCYLIGGRVEKKFARRDLLLDVYPYPALSVIEVKR